MWTIKDRLDFYAKWMPDKPAIIDLNGAMTYGQYRQLVCRAATGISDDLKETYYGMAVVNRPIVVLTYRDRYSVIAMMGVALTHNFYIPLDHTNPDNRFKTLLEKIRPAAIIAEAEDIDRMRSFSKDVPVIDISNLLSSDIDEERLEAIAEDIIPSEPVCAITTSGSTGMPKVVLKSYESVRDFIPLFCVTFDLSKDDVFGNISTFEYDVAGKDIYASIYLGATMYIVPQGVFGADLIGALNDNKVTTLVWPVAALRNVVSLNAFSVDSPLYVKKVLFSGEAIQEDVLEAWRESLPDTVFVNLYGPTEVTYNCTYFVIDRDYTVIDQVPLGIPFSDQKVRYLNDDNEEIKTGERGEICISGVPIAMGYYFDKKRTDEAFVVGPDGQRMYRTGDIAELHQDGQYYFVGRGDNQIKHFGHRIELEEIEHYAKDIEGVTNAGCIFDEESDRVIMVYSGEIDERDLVSELAIDLPKYMMPNQYILMDDIPLTQNGKIDRKAVKRELLDK